VRHGIFLVYFCFCFAIDDSWLSKDRDGCDGEKSISNSNSFNPPCCRVYLDRLIHSGSPAIYMVPQLVTIVVFWFP